MLRKKKPVELEPRQTDLDRLHVLEKKYRECDPSMTPEQLLELVKLEDELSP